MVINQDLLGGMSDELSAVKNPISDGFDLGR
jgi:hypothetical protein